MISSATTPPMDRHAARRAQYGVRARHDTTASDCSNAAALLSTLNRPGFPGDSNMRQDGACGRGKAVFK